MASRRRFRREPRYVCVDPTLTIVGASTRAAAQSAVRAGFCVRAGDLFGDVDLRRLADVSVSANYPADLADVVTGPQSGAWMYTGALENHPALVSALAQARTLWGNGAAVLRRVRDPLAVARAFGRHGIACPKVAVRTDRVAPQGRWLAKPRRSAGGTRISVWDRAASPGRFRGGRYFQQFVEGDAQAAVYLAAGGRAVLLGVTRQLVGLDWTGAGGFQYCGSVGPLEPDEAYLEQYTRIGNVLAGEFELTGLFGVDTIVNGEGVWPVEVNPRFPASAEILERATGASVIAWHAAACEEGRLPVPPRHRGRTFGKAIPFARTRCVTPQLLRDSARPGLAAADEPADVPRPGTVVEPGWPIVTVFAEGGDEATVIHRLQKRVAAVQAQLVACPADSHAR
ncbi:MAG: ATP-grasp domain-containing protein [Planctomycetota bacterium]|nr:MAG: ATP-grasp domain-containing protein [Planctomycetota bacterium]